MNRSILVASLALIALVLAAGEALAQTAKEQPVTGQTTPSEKTTREVKVEKAAPAAGKDAEKAAPAAGAQPAKDQEVEVPVSQLPSAVRRTLERESYGGKVLEVERETKAGKTLYEADVKLDSFVYAVVISPEGKLLSKTLDDDDDEEDDDEEDDDDDDDDEDDDDEDDASKAATPVKRS